MDRNKLFQELYNIYCSAYPQKTKRECQSIVSHIWNDSKKDKNFETVIRDKINDFKQKHLQSKANFFNSWKNSAKKKVHTGNETCSQLVDSSQSEIVGTSSNSDSSIVCGASVSSSNNRMENLSTSFEEMGVSTSDTSKDEDNRNVMSQSSLFPTPAQDKLRTEIATLNDDVATLSKIRNNGLFDGEMKTVLDKKRSTLKTKQKLLKKVTKNMIRKRKYRQEFKKKLANICEKYPEAKNELKVDSSILNLVELVTFQSFD